MCYSWCTAPGHGKPAAPDIELERSLPLSPSEAVQLRVWLDDLAVRYRPDTFAGGEVGYSAKRRYALAVQLGERLTRVITEGR